MSLVDTLVIPLLKILIVLNAVLVGVTFMVLLERKVIAWVQVRLGPELLRFFAGETIATAGETEDSLDETKVGGVDVRRRLGAQRQEVTLFETQPIGAP